MPGTSQQDITFDAWTPASFKRVLGNRTVSSSFLAPTWVGEHARRLTAYKLLQSYVDNVSRFFLQTDERKSIDDHREYGDASVVVEQILSAVIGETQVIRTEGAPNAEPVTEGEAQPDEQAMKAWQLQQWMRQWAKDERLPIKMIENERNAIIMGDGVYTLGIDPDKGRVRLRVFDPGFYFPVLHDGNEDEFPEKVHVAWEIPDEDKPDHFKIRRLTWEMVPLETPRVFAGKTKKSRKECVFSDGTWTISKTGAQKVDDLSPGTVRWSTYTDENGEEVEIHQIPLELDDLAVVHIPNTVALLNHFGKSSLMPILQILDDIANADTDLSAASATTGTPPVALSGASLGQTKPTYKAGDVWELGPNGKLDVLDTSRSLDALLKYIDALLSRLSINARLPESVLGRLKPSEVPSGIALALSFGPMVSMINQMRMIRTEKYRLLFKMVWRLSVENNLDEVPPEYIETGIDFGPFLPADRQAAVDMVNKLLNIEHPAISLESAVQILMLAGVPIEDALTEVANITKRDFDGAVKLYEATQDRELVFAFLQEETPEWLEEHEKALREAEVRPDPPPVAPGAGAGAPEQGRLPGSPPPGGAA